MPSPPAPIPTRALRSTLRPKSLLLVGLLALLTIAPVNCVQKIAAESAGTPTIDFPYGVSPSDLGPWYLPPVSSLGAVRQQFLRSRPGGDIGFPLSLNLRSELTDGAPDWTRLPTALRTNLDSIDMIGGNAYHVGWPFRAFTMTEVRLRDDPPVRRGTTSLKWPEVHGSLTTPFGIDLPGPDVPIHPLWPWPILNVAVYFAIWFTLKLAVDATRLWIQARFIVPSEHCLHCRYDLSRTPHQDPCPECGRTDTRNIKRSA